MSTPTDPRLATAWLLAEEAVRGELMPFVPPLMLDALVDRVMAAVRDHVGLEQVGWATPTSENAFNDPLEASHWFPWFVSEERREPEVGVPVYRVTAAGSVP